MFTYSKKSSFKFPKLHLIAALLAAANLAACDGGPERVKPADGARLLGTAPAVTVQAVPAAWHEGQLPILRFQMDAARERGWILTPAGVLLFDFKSRQTMHLIALPEWHWAGEPYGSTPDLALGPTGDVLVTSDVLPVLWHIDAVTMRVSRHELALDQDGGRDIGFSGLAYSAAHRSFFAVSHVHGSLWRIDQQFRRAQKIPLSAPLAGAESLSIPVRGARRGTSPLPSLCAHSPQGDWSINFAPDQRSGYVFARSCIG